MKTSPFGRRILASFCAGLTLVACQALLAATATVNIKNFSFQPSATTVNVGDTVTWVQQDSTTHTSTSDDGASWDSGNLSLNQSFSFVFNSVATFPYHCTRHPSMTGSVTVQAAAVNQPPTISITSPTNGAVFAAPLTGTIQVNASDPDDAVVKVDFFNGTTLIGTMTNAPFTLSLVNIPGGQYVLTAKATDARGVSTVSSAVTITVDNPPTVSITSPTNDTLFITGTSTTIAANAGDSDGTVTQVAFYKVNFCGGPVSSNSCPPTLLATATHAPFNLALTNLSSGFLHIEAQATDNLGLTTMSVPVRLIIYRPVRFQAVKRVANGAAQLNFTGDSFVIDGSADLKLWSSVTNAPTQNADGSWLLLDNSASAMRQRFYRARHVFNEILPL